jgi:hypothetical protein
MSMPDGSDLVLARHRIDRLLERLARTSFRDQTEREILVGELQRMLAGLTPAASAIRSPAADEPLDEAAVDSALALAGAESAVRALAARDSKDAFAVRLAHVQRAALLLLAAAEDLVASRAFGPVPQRVLEASVRAVTA